MIIAPVSQKLLFFSYISVNGTLHFSDQAQKILKKSTRENFSYSNFKKFHIFSKKMFLYFRKRRPRKNFLYFLKSNFFLNFGKQKPRKKFFIFQEVTFRARKIKRTHPGKISYISGKGNLNPKLKKRLIFLDKTPSVWKSKFHIFCLL